MERIFIKLYNGATIMDLAHAQPKLFDAEHARGGVESFKLRKIAFVVCGHASTRSSALSIKFADM